MNDNSDYSHVEIDGGEVRAVTKTDASGTRNIPTLVGSYRYFVGVVEKDGCKVSMWDGPSHSEALIEAASLCREFGLTQVVDKTQKGAA